MVSVMSGIAATTRLVMRRRVIEVLVSIMRRRLVIMVVAA